MERWVNRFAEVGEELAQAPADCSVSFYFTRPAALDSVVDKLLFTGEPSS